MNEAMTPLVRFEGVSKRYRLGLTRTSLPTLIAEGIRDRLRPGAARRPADRVLWALRDVSFELARGESMALIGPNGAGKSTLLKLLSRITMPSEGEINVHGRLSALIELGAGFHPDLTGRENIYLNGTILGLSRQYISRRFDEIVAFSELEDFLDTPVKRYSSGMEVRLGFAVAACIEPEILLIDEVLAVGDTSFREKCLERIRTLIDRGTSVIFVSHNLYMAQAVCKRALYIHKGRIKSAGDAATVIQAYEREIHLERAQKFDAARARDAGLQLDAATAAEITDVIVEGRPRDGSDAIDASGPARIHVHYHAYADVASINMAAFIIRSDGVTCAMARTKLDGVELRLSRGRGTVTLTLGSLQLVTGTYFVEVELTNASDSMVLKAAPTRSGWFSVEGRSRSYDARSGVFEPIVRWDHAVDPASAAGHAVHGEVGP